MDITVTTEQGTLRGGTRTTFKGQEFLSFTNIPYAKPPVGSLRFKEPQPPEKWFGIRDATQPIKICISPQIQFHPELVDKVAVVDTDDNLILNVYTHKLLSKENDPLKPVMVSIHGGAFTLGSSGLEMSGPDILMTQDIVMVTINYRLGAFGFLDLYDIGIGNNGLKDMVMALKWVKKNIKQFGGDPDNVTIFGISAGGAAVHYLTLSPLAKGLFHKAIAQSGSALNTWARGQRNNGFKLAHSMGCTEDDPKKVLQFLQKQSPMDIFDAQTALGDHFTVTYPRYFSPTIEKESKSAFLSEEPVKLIFKGQFNDVPLMTGFTSMEGLLSYLLDVTANFEISKTEFVPYFLDLEPKSEEFDETNKKITQFYFKKEKADPDDVAGHVAINSDNLFVRGIYQTVKGHASNSSKPVYLYRMTLDTKLNLKHSFPNMPPVTGCCHGDDMGYLYRGLIPVEIVPGSPEEKGIHCFVKLWTNFARTGNPTSELDDIVDIDWKPVTPIELNYLDLGNKLSLEVDPEAERMRFWDEMYESSPDRY